MNNYTINIETYKCRVYAPDNGGLKYGKSTDWFTCLMFLMPNDYRSGQFVCQPERLTTLAIL